MPLSFFFFFNDTATTEIYTLSLHDALPIYQRYSEPRLRPRPPGARQHRGARGRFAVQWRSEEHTSELQSHLNLVCRLLLEKKKRKYTIVTPNGGVAVPSHTSALLRPGTRTA